jgi:hypothetical protein
MRTFAPAALTAVLSVAAACTDNRGADTVLTPATTTPVTQTPTPSLQILGAGAVTTRYTGEIAVRGTTAYTTTALKRVATGNAVFIWDVSGNTPTLVDSIVYASTVSDVGDVEISDDGKVMVVVTEFTPGEMIVYDLADPRHPRELSRFAGSGSSQGYHTGKLGRVNGTLYAFISAYPAGGGPRLIIVDLSNPSSPKEVFTSTAFTNPWMHDTFVRDGFLFLAVWNDGIQIMDLGGGGTGSPSNPRVISTTPLATGTVHNLWWYRDASGARRYVFAGQEGGQTIPTSSFGDIHVLDVSDLGNPREVAFYHINGAGPHNFFVDEANGILYAAYYNAGIRALDVHGDLGSCTSAQRSTTNGVTRCDLRAMGRELAIGLATGLGAFNANPPYVWGVQYVNGILYASDLDNGIWKLKAVR